jgi:metal-responsive CopG/Arc/MetJ family transcriptional regulator
MKRLSIAIPKTLRQKLDVLSRRKQLSVNDVVCEAVRRYLAVERLNEIRRRTRRRAEARGFLTEEDVLRIERGQVATTLAKWKSRFAGRKLSSSAKMIRDDRAR